MGGNKSAEADRIEAIAEKLVRQGWTVAEFSAACDLIESDAALQKEIDYDRGMSLNVLTVARERIEVVAGRLHRSKAIRSLCRKASQPFPGGAEPVWRINENGRQIDNAPRWVIVDPDRFRTNE